MSDVTLLSQDGSLCRVPEPTAREWRWYLPITAGRFVSRDSYEVPFNREQLEMWLSIPETPQYHTPLKYEDMILLADFFMPKSDDWRYYSLPGSMSLEERKQCYLQLGRYIRRQGLTWPWRDIVKSAPVHHNFYVAYDPVYTSYREDNVVLYRQPINEQVAMALELDEISIVTGVVHAAWLKSNHSDTTEEVPWYFIDWAVIGGLSYPNLLHETCSQFNIVGALSRVESLHVSRMNCVHCRPTYAQLALVLAARDKDIADEGTSDKHYSCFYSWFINARRMSETTKRLSISLENVLDEDSTTLPRVKKLVTNVPRSMELYRILLAQLSSDVSGNVLETGGSSGRDSDVFSHWPGYYVDAYHYSLMSVCGLMPLFLTEEQIHRRSAPYEQCRALSDDTNILGLLGMTTRYMLARGKLGEDHCVRVIKPEDYDDILRQGLKTIGKEAVAHISIILMEIYKHTNLPQALEFSQAVDKCLRE